MNYHYTQEELDFIRDNPKAKNLKDDLEKEGLRFTIERYTEYLDFKSKHRGDNRSERFFIAKFGEEKGKELHREYCVKRQKQDLNTKAKYIERYGEEKGTLLWDERIQKQKFMQSEPGFIHRYGEEEGKRLYKKMNATKGRTKEQIIKEKGEEAYKELIDKKTMSLENCVRKFGEEEGNKKWKEYCERSIMYGDGKRPNQILYWTKQGYSEEEAKKKVSESQTKFSLDICIAKHGKEEGTRIWKERQDKWQNTLKNLPNYDEICKSRGTNAKGEPHYGYLNEKTIPVYFDNTPGILYFIQITLETGRTFWKVGITHKTVNERFEREIRRFDLDVIREIKFENLLDAFKLEQHILSTFSENRTTVSADFFRSTECFNKNVLEGMTDEDIRNLL